MKWSAKRSYVIDATSSESPPLLRSMSSVRIPSANQGCVDGTYRSLVPAVGCLRWSEPLSEASVEFHTLLAAQQASQGLDAQGYS